MSKKFDEMDKSELKEAIIANDLQDEVVALGKHESKVTARDLLAILKDGVTEVVEDEPEVIKGPPTEPKPVTDEDKVEFNNLRAMYIVSDHDQKTSMEELEEGRVLNVISGNTLNKNGYPVKLDGQPQYLPNKVIKKLKSITSVQVTTPHKGQKTHRLVARPRFSVASAGFMTQQELDAKVKEQEATRGLNL